MKNQRGKRKHVFYIPMTKEAIKETCKLRHDIGRTGHHCGDCIYNEVCGRREDR